MSSNWLLRYRVRKVYWLNEWKQGWMSKTDSSYEHHLLCMYRQWVERGEYPKRHIWRQEGVGREKTKLELFIILLRFIPVCVHQPVWNKRELIPNSDCGMTSLEMNREQLIYYIQSCFIVSSEAIDWTYHAARQI